MLCVVYFPEKLSAQRRDANCGLAWMGSFETHKYIYRELLCEERSNKIGIYINDDLFIPQVYSALFQPLRVTRHQFKTVLNCMKLVRSLKYQEVYAQEKVTKVDSLSLVLSGK